MALYYSLYDRDVENEHEWHIGESTKNMNDYGLQCVKITADGDELTAIHTQFKNIPLHNNRRVQHWGGDFAAFIAMNLK